jgi:hypothetical protein
MSMCGNAVVMTSTAESMKSKPTMTVASAFSQGRFTQGPSTARSLQSSSRKMLALGSSTPASAWTATVMTPSGAPGMSTIAPAEPTIAAKMP